MDFTGITQRSVDRRTLLRTGAWAGLLAGTAAVPLLGATPASAATSPRFDLKHESKELLREKRMPAIHWTLQSLTVDNVHQHCYFIQNLPNSHTGDLWLNRWDLKANKVTGRMALHGFGHGSQIGVDVHEGKVYIWVESKAAKNGFGTELARFAFVSGATINAKSPGVTHLKPKLSVPVNNPQPTVDPISNQLFVRFRGANHQPYLAVYTLANARAGKIDKPETVIKTPLRSASYEKDRPAQGFTGCGRYAYLFEGGNNQRTSYITEVDTETGKVTHDHVPTQAGKTLNGREPEGMAIRLVNGKPHLLMGFKSREKKQIDNKNVYRVSVYYKDRLI